MRKSLFFIVALSALVLEQPAHALSFATYDTGNTSELLATVPGDDVRRVLFSVDVGPINAGDVLVVYSEAELTNHNFTNARIGALLVLGSSATATTGTELGEYNSFRISPAMFHAKRNKQAIQKFTANQSSTFVNLVVDANADLEVEQDFGRLQVLKITP